jgi:hypothetical protein
MRCWLLVLISLFASLPAFARLGETEAQSVARYGEAIAIADAGPARSLEFVKDDFIIVVNTLNGKSVCEAYKNKNHPLTESEITEILTKNGGGDWKRGESNSGQWMALDGSDQGASLTGNTLVIWTVGGRDALTIIKSSETQHDQITSQKQAKQSTSGL